MKKAARLATRLRELMGDKVRPLADCDDPSTWLSVLRSGQCRYVCAVNLHLLPQPWNELHRYIGYENSTFPAVTTVRLNLPAGPPPAIYDVLNGKLLTPRKDGAAWLVEADMRVFPGAILALLPRPIAALRLSGGQTADQATLRLIARPVDARDTPIDGAVPLHVLLADPTGAIRYELDRTSRAGQWEQELPLAANDSAGVWTLTVQELLGGHQVVAHIEVTPPALPAGTQAVTPNVEWTRLPEAVAGLRQAKTIALLVSKKQQEACKPAIEAALQALQPARPQTAPGERGGLSGRSRRFRMGQIQARRLLARHQIAAQTIRSDHLLRYARVAESRGRARAAGGQADRDRPRTGPGADPIRHHAGVR